MVPSQVIHIGVLSFRTMLLVAAPLLGITLAVGLVVGIFQATTQINEPTLSFVPKVLGTVLAVLIFGSWMMGMMMSYTQSLWGLIPGIGQ